MTRGLGSDRFRAEWLVVALRALLDAETTARRSSTVGIDVDGQLLQVRATRSGTEVSPHDGRDLDAVVRADAPIVLGLAAGVLTLDDTTGLVDIEGDDAAAQAVFNPRAPMSEAPFADDRSLSVRSVHMCGGTGVVAQKSRVRCDGAATVAVHFSELLRAPANGRSRAAGGSRGRPARAR